MIDFSSLVLAPNMAIFGRPVTIDPRASQPGKVPYAARGIFTSRPYEVQLENNSVLSDQRTTLDVRIAEFTIPPKQRDYITIDSDQYFVADVNLDGQGGMQLILRHVTP